MVRVCQIALGPRPACAPAGHAILVLKAGARSLKRITPIGNAAVARFAQTVQPANDRGLARNVRPGKTKIEPLATANKT